MKIQLWSDLHLEFYRDGIADFLRQQHPHPEADVLVLAGDICSLKRGPVQLSEVFEYVAPLWRDVVYVPGNHEFYGTSLGEGWAAIRSAAAPHANVHVLRNGATKIGGVSFYGGTGWFPEVYNHPLAPYGAEEIDLRRGMNDFRLIKGFEPGVYREHRDFADGLQLLDAAPDVVVTHHLPQEECVSPKYKGDPLNCFFVSCFEVEQFGAKLWLHGHTHDLVDTVIGKTRVVANPYGYPREFSERRWDAYRILEA